MSFFQRIVNIIRSNINSGKPEINMADYEDLYYEDLNDTPQVKSKDEEYYRILEVPYGADFKEVKSSYRKLLKKYHPDLFVNNSEKSAAAQKLVKKINEAYNYFERNNL